ncbi:hypothetical protein JHK87_053667 [Glycine soja]|nr:hypothetical protein JHK87_053667 [Glycine soja]
MSMESESKNDTEVAPALIAVHPDQSSVAVAVGPHLRVFDLLSSEKRVTAVAISNDGTFVCFADKFGVVWVVDVDPPLHDKKPAPLLSHYCSIITSLEFSPDGRFILSADRDFKIRVTNFPQKPLNGAHQIQSFCLGHTEFVSCLAFIQAQECPQGLLLSGSGDSTVSNLFNIPAYFLYDSLLDESNVNCFLQVVSVAGEAFVPTCLGSSPSIRKLWMVTGVSGLPGCNYLSLARVRVISGIDVEQEPVVPGDDNIPGGEKLLETLQGSASVDDSAFLATAEAVKTAMCNLLIKKQYPSENREYRKKSRNDRKLKG